jgi:hypothetical protein
MRFPPRFHALYAGLAAAAVLGIVATQTQMVAADQAARQIPGITAKDAFPNGCVDCHTATSKMGDTRISTLMTKWTTAVAPPLLAKSKASATDPARVKGKHPPVPKPGANVPQSCLAVCHKKGSTVAPAFGTLMHNLHLTGTPNQFMTLFQGECTHCHKLDQKTGAWRMATGAEK